MSSNQSLELRDKGGKILGGFSKVNFSLTYVSKITDFAKQKLSNFIHPIPPIPGIEFAGRKGSKSAFNGRLGRIPVSCDDTASQYALVGPGP